MFAVGRLLGYMLTGVMPDEDRIGEFESALRDEPRVAPSMRLVIERATDFEPSARYQGMDELAVALAAANARDGSAADAARLPMPAPEEPRGAAPSSTTLGPGDEEAGPNGPAGGRHLSAIGVATVVLACAAALMGLVIAYRVLVRDRPGSHVAAVESVIEDDPVVDESGNLDDPPSDAVVAGNLDRAFESLGIVESGWTADKGGYVNYAVTLENTSEDLIIEYPELVITGRDAAGSVVFSTSQVMGIIFPKSTMTFACTAGDGVAPATVEFSLARPRDYQVSAGTGAATEYRVHDVASHRDSYGTLTVSGEVEKVSEGDEPLPVGDVWLSVVLRDGEGGIVSGANTFVGSPSVGERMPFSLQIHSCPQYEVLEVVPLDH